MTPTKRLIRLPEVRHKTGLRTDSVYRLIKAGKFPRQVKLSERASAWSEQAINDWIASRSSEPLNLVIARKANQSATTQAATNTVDVSATSAVTHKPTSRASNYASEDA